MDKVCKFFLSIILFMELLSGCSMEGGGEAKENSIAFDSLKVEKTAHLLDKEENPNCRLTLAFAFPSDYSSEETLQKLQQFYIQSFFGERYKEMTPQDALAHYAADYIAEYKTLETDFAKDLEHVTKDMPMGNWYSYYEMANNTLEYNAKGIVSFQVAFENYTGGVHPSHAYTNHTFSLELGKEIVEDDIFMDGFQKELAKIIVDYLVQQNKLKEPIELENIGFFSVDEIVPNENFLIKEDGLLYTFNEYEIAAYALGRINVFLPYGKIRHLFREGNPITSLYAN